MGTLRDSSQSVFNLLFNFLFDASLPWGTVLGETPPIRDLVIERSETQGSAPPNPSRERNPG
jgi:hypothetical protein